MSRYAFNITERGFLHIKKDIPCEDSSGCFEDDDNRYAIAVVADGHGDPACFRADRGSKFAVKACIDSLRGFAETILESKQEDESSSFIEKLSYGKSAESTMRQLTNSIISRWGELVSDDLANNPCTETELLMAGDMAELYRKGNKLLHIYGTTLIAALLVNDYLILIQQGDGRCDVFYEDGTVNQPIPWDDRCFENETTSLCDSDVVTSIRHCIISVKNNKPIACFLSSDGVEDSFINEPMDGVHTFNRGLCAMFFTAGQERFLEELHSILPGFSESGSGDDVSVAGIFNVEKIEVLLPYFAEQNMRYELVDTKVALENKLNSMTRKHGILLAESDKAKRIVEAKEAEIAETQQLIIELKEKRSSLLTRIEQISLDIEETNRIHEETQASVDSQVDRLKRIPNIKNLFLEGIKSFQDDTSKKLNRIQRQLSEIERQIDTAEKKLSEQYEARDKLTETERKLYAEFEAYDSKFRAIEKELSEVNETIHNGTSESAPEPI